MTRPGTTRTSAVVRSAGFTCERLGDCGCGFVLDETVPWQQRSRARRSQYELYSGSSKARGGPAADGMLDLRHHRTKAVGSSLSRGSTQVFLVSFFVEGDHKQANM